MSRNIDMHPEPLIQFRVEVNKHPDLAEKFKGITEFYDLVGAVAAELGIAVDGSYSFYEILKLLDTLTVKLQERRTSIILSVH